MFMKVVAIKMKREAEERKDKVESYNVDEKSPDNRVTERKICQPFTKTTVIKGEKNAKRQEHAD